MKKAFMLREDKGSIQNNEPRQLTRPLPLNLATEKRI